MGGFAAFRRFLRSELMPAVEARYRTTEEKAIVGESLAGLFVVETLLLEPDLFDTYVAFEPSLWWNDRQLLDTAGERLRAPGDGGRTLYLASGAPSELTTLAERLAAVLRERAPSTLSWHHEPMPEETHATIYHPAALRAFRRLFAPVPTPTPR